MTRNTLSSTRLTWDGKTNDLSKQPLRSRIWETVFPRPVFATDQPLFEDEATVNINEVNIENRFFYGDNLDLLKIMINEQIKIDLIYIDPPYMSNIEYHSNIETQDEKIDRIAFGDNWEKGIDSYLEMLYPRLLMMQQVLSESGSILVHVDWHVSHYVRIILDEIFGIENFVNEIIWCYGGGSRPKKNFQRKHDSILWYAKSDNYVFNPMYRPYTKGTIERGLTKVKANYKLHTEGALMHDWWTDINKILSPTAFENLKYPTQKPRELIKRLISAASNPGNTVADFFAGSGTTAEAANELGRKWICADNSNLSLQTSHYRLIKAGSPFLIESTYDLSLDGSGSLSLKPPILQFYDENHYLMNIGVESYSPIDCSRGGTSYNGNNIEFWELDPNYRADIFNSCYQIVRKGQRFKGIIPLDITIIVPKQEDYTIAVKVYDLYACTSQRIINIRP